MSGIVHKIEEKLHIGGKDGDEKKHKATDEKKHKPERKSGGSKSEDHKEGIVDKIKNKVHGDHGEHSGDEKDGEKKKKKGKKTHEGGHKSGSDSSSSSDSD